ncbi:TMEM165/GDT1 family protein [Pseudobacteriovorax antillogorgiicola]|uniref:GDT1 family protein n=1 Tax=Pseudobacteriovorax antillogorgiicola TaxID=1513793 RepID=A0A1Y6B7Z3_9BACT|nr:TMEM165/GDT1 family protein [Pseudobacteriovorax antillogorgiicola]TCS58547.1 uncharacterized protein UPF0016 [Pseudobacteriovorax antillogorgiicola]SME97751.1 Uncharacterized protein family UPF0016 [Pseudobacteriovorax antillogorgiicola]
MDWKVFLTTFGAIFIAELGDKTQFAAIAASAGSSSKLSVLLGVVLGLALAGTLGVIAGSLLGEFIKPSVMKWLSGSLFIVVGVWILLTS